jgi:glycosyltransferase involved in cell wall biosynthesis
MRVLLVSNYLPDRQWSMLRFAELMSEALASEGHDVQVTRPKAWLGPLVGIHHGMHKWLAYVDKYLVFPRQLRQLSAGWDVTHVCDHSNAVYRPSIRSRAQVVTCHDLLAVRGALGEDTYCPASTLGRKLQAAILRHLTAIPWVACDSTATLTDFSRLTGRPAGPGVRRILLGFEGGFQPVLDKRRLEEVGTFGLTPFSYLLHVGSSQRRKNREAILKMVAHLANRWRGKIVFAGETLTAEQRKLAGQLGLWDRIVEISGADDGKLSLIYSGALALVFPSYCEGFGWPLLEAQACGCPVITADNTSLPEVAGQGGVILPADDIEGMAMAVLSLTDADRRGLLVKLGFENLERFTVQRMVAEYVTLYEEALATG